jgi:hypothetical protein
VAVAVAVAVHRLAKGTISRTTTIKSRTLLLLLALAALPCKSRPRHRLNRLRHAAPRLRRHPLKPHLPVARLLHRLLSLSRNPRAKARNRLATSSHRTTLRLKLNQRLCASVPQAALPPRAKLRLIIRRPRPPGVRPRLQPLLLARLLPPAMAAAHQPRSHLTKKSMSPRKHMTPPHPRRSSIRRTTLEPVKSRRRLNSLAVAQAVISNNACPTASLLSLDQPNVNNLCLKLPKLRLQPPIL